MITYGFNNITQNIEYFTDIKLGNFDEDGNIELDNIGYKDLIGFFSNRYDLDNYLKWNNKSSSYNIKDAGIKYLSDRLQSISTGIFKIDGLFVNGKINANVLENILYYFAEKYYDQKIFSEEDFFSERGRRAWCNFLSVLKGDSSIEEEKSWPYPPITNEDDLLNSSLLNINISQLELDQYARDYLLYTGKPQPMFYQNGQPNEFGYAIILGRYWNELCVREINQRIAQKSTGDKYLKPYLFEDLYSAGKLKKEAKDIFPYYNGEKHILTPSEEKSKEDTLNKEIDTYRSELKFKVDEFSSSSNSPYKNALQFLRNYDFSDMNLNYSYKILTDKNNNELMYIVQDSLEGGKEVYNPDDASTDMYRQIDILNVISGKPTQYEPKMKDKRTLFYPANDSFEYDMIHKEQSLMNEFNKKNVFTDFLNIIPGVATLVYNSRQPILESFHKAMGNRQNMTSENNKLIHDIIFENKELSDDKEIEIYGYKRTKWVHKDSFAKALGYKDYLCVPKYHRAAFEEIKRAELIFLKDNLASNDKKIVEKFYYDLLPLISLKALRYSQLNTPSKSEMLGRDPKYDPVTNTYNANEYAEIEDQRNFHKGLSYNPQGKGHDFGEYTVFSLDNDALNKGAEFVYDSSSNQAWNEKYEDKEGVQYEYKGFKAKEIKYGQIAGQENIKIIDAKNMIDKAFFAFGLQPYSKMALETTLIRIYGGK